MFKLLAFKERSGIYEYTYCSEQIILIAGRSSKPDVLRMYCKQNDFKGQLKMTF